MEADESQVVPFKNIPVARLLTEPVPVSKCTPIENAYEALSELIERGELIVDRFEDKTPEQLDWWYNGLCEELKRKNMKEIPDCSYAKFVQKKLPEVWARYMQSI